jgi:hypothetical protein
MLLHAAVFGRPRAGRLDPLTRVRHGCRSVWNRLIPAPLLVRGLGLIEIERLTLR